MDANKLLTMVKDTRLDDVDEMCAKAEGGMGFVGGEGSQQSSQISSFPYITGKAHYIFDKKDFSYDKFYFQDTQNPSLPCIN